jgi:hypothetical protein
MGKFMNLYWIDRCWHSELGLLAEDGIHEEKKLHRDLPDGSAQVKVIGAPGAYEVDWWSPEPSEDWPPVKRGEFDDTEESNG